MDVLIRQVQPEDLEGVVCGEAACFPEAEAGTRDSFIQRIDAFPESFFVAEMNGAIIGFINGCVTDSQVIEDEMFEDVRCHKPDGAYQSVFGLSVLPEYQHQGLASRLMLRLTEAAKTSGRQGMILTCKDRLIGFYETFGYQSLGVSKSVHGGAVWYDMILEFEPES